MENLEPDVVKDLLRLIEQALAGGLRTHWTERAYDSAQVDALTARLRALEPDELEARLVLAGFTLHPYVAQDDTDGLEQNCATCMYFERHRGWCNLSELMLPVAPQWSCVLWRI
jgi:hypothetical protein